MTEKPPLDEFAADILRRCQIALADDGHPYGAWSTGEKLAVALVLLDWPYLRVEGYTPAEAWARVAGGTWSPPADPRAWLAAIRHHLESDLS